MERNENGKFAKGNKGGGRLKGSENRATGELREFISNFIDENKESIISDFEKLEPKERIDVFLKLAEFILPKLNRTELEGNFKNSVVISLVDDTNLKLNNHEQSN